MSGRSLRRRLAAGAVAGVTAAMLLTGVGLALLFERHATRVLAGDLDVVLRQLAGAVEVDAAGGLRLSREPADPRFAAPLSGVYWQVGDDQGRFLASRSLWDARLDLEADSPAAGEIHYHDIAGPGGQRLLAAERVILIGAPPAGPRVRLAAAMDRGRLADARAGFVRDLAPGLILLGAVLALAAWVQIGLGLAPLALLRAGLAGIRDGTARRLSPDAPLEVRPLVDEINALLAAQAEAVARAQGRAADLAHGLKTPLSALAADARRLRAGGDAEMAAGIESLGEAMRRHIDRALVRARLDAHGLGARGAATALEPVLRGVVATLARTEAGDRVRFELSVPPAIVWPFDRGDLAEVLGALLENAARHARGRVRVTAAADGMLIEDDGAGIAPADRDRVLKRGIRLDESGPGSGLGLAIAQDVLDAYDWSLSLGASALGGLAAGIAPKGSGAARSPPLA